MMMEARSQGQDESMQDSKAESVEIQTSICRGCLMTGRRMVNAMLFEASIKDLTGITISPSDGLPQWLCYQCSALLQKCVTFRNKVMKSHYRLCQYVLESVPIALDEDATPHLSRTSVLHYHIAGTQTDKLEENIDDTIIYYDIDMLRQTNNVKVKNEPTYSDYEDIDEEEGHREVIPLIQLLSDAASINHSVKAEEECTKAASVESLVVTEAAPARHSLRARLRFDDDTSSYIEEPATHSNDIEETTAREIQERDKGKDESCKHRDILSKCGQVNDIDNDVKSSSRGDVQSYDKETQYTADTTSTRHSDDAKEEVKHKIDRSDSVNRLSSRINIQSYICDTCNEFFSNKNILITHIGEHSGKSFKCDVCNKCFSDESTFTKHSRVQCDVCKKCYRYKTSLRRHLLQSVVHAVVKPYKCDVCMKCFTNSAHLKTHIQIHASKRPSYVCDICAKSFTRKASLVHHIHVHTGYKPYKCNLCLKCFTRQCDLNNHLRTHTGDKPYKCDVCMRCYSQHTHLSRHYRTHTGDQPYKCDTCMKRFCDKTVFKNHVRLHTGDKPYKCNVCMKRFPRQHDLRYHIRLHTGDKPYKCDLCMKSFPHSSSLSRHYSMHTDVKSYKCDVCMKRFGDKEHLKTHSYSHQS